jgi:arsenite methyltransferase
VTGVATKSCCAIAYESEIARWLMGESFHPGGLALTERLGEALELTSGSRVLDVASGRGASALHLAERFGCAVVGLDLGAANIEAARSAAFFRKLDHLVTFEQGDAEHLPFRDGAFDAVICECAFCLFPDKASAAREFARVLKPSGVIGLTDLVRDAELPSTLDSLMAWVACIADARPLETYLNILAGADLVPSLVERHDACLAELAYRARQQLLAAEILVGLGKLSWPGFDFKAANELARQVRTAINSGQLGYALIKVERGATGTRREH